MSKLVFGDIPEEYSTYQHSRVLILPIPYEHSTTYLKGTARGPEAILKASYEIELFDEQLKQETFRIGIHTLPFMTINSHSEEFLNQVETEVLSHLNHNKILAILGGEHSITLGAVKAVRKFFPNIGVLQIDAHADLRDSYQNDPYSHACVMRRVLSQVPLYQIYRSYINKLDMDLEKAHRRLKELGKQVKAKENVLKEETIRKKTLENLKDLQFDRFMQQLNKEEQKEMDEVVILRRGGSR